MSQNDFVIDNNTANAARLDIQSAFQALASNNSGNSAPATPYPNQLWYETDTNRLRIRNEGNTAWLDVAYIDQSDGFEVLDNTKVVTTSGTQTGLLGDQSTATWEAGTGTTESLVSPAKVKAAIEQNSVSKTAGAVGTYGAFNLVTSTLTDPNATVSGSNLKWANFFTYGGVGYKNQSPSGTWRCMGASGYYEGGTGYESQRDKRSTLWLRIS